MRTGRPQHRGYGLVVMLTLSFPGTAGAQQPASRMDDVLQTLQLKAKVAPAPDFVTASRPRQSGFIPVGTPHPVRSQTVMTPAEVTAAEADLDATRERQQRRAGQRPAPVPLKQAKAAKVSGKKTVP